jgi:hypothetical protein
MYLQELLEVAIGLVFMWLIVSVAAMSVQEWFANLLEWRSNDLQSAIRKMLANPELATQFYDHQIIRGLSKDKNWWQNFETWLGNLVRKLFRQPVKFSELKPSYIPASDFALTLFDMVVQAGGEASPVKKAFSDMSLALENLSLERLNYENRQNAQKFLDEIMEEATSIATTEIGQDSIDVVRSQIIQYAEDHPEIKDTVNGILLYQLDQYYSALINEQTKYPKDEFDKDLNFKRVRIGLLAIQQTSPKLHESLRGLFEGVEEYINDKETALAIARNNVETWFDDSMDRLSGWYKRKAQIMAFIFGLVFAILLNVDSIVLATSLWREPTLRQTIVAQAQSYALQNQQLLNGSTGILPPQKSVAELQQELTTLQIPFGWETQIYTLKPGEICQIIPFSKNAIWGVRSSNICKQIINAPMDSTGWLAKIAGILITGLAAAQGAPFWYDILKKLANVRSTGPNPAEQTPQG